MQKSPTLINCTTGDRIDAISDEATISDTLTLIANNEQSISTQKSRTMSSRKCGAFSNFLSAERREFAKTKKKMQPSTQAATASPGERPPKTAYMPVMNETTIATKAHIVKDTAK